MRLAYFSPLAPKRTGIATYSAHLAVALAAHAEIDFFDTAPSEAPLPGADVQDFIARPELLDGLPNYDAVLYHLGNNPYYHLDIYRAFRRRPGVVVLHDTVLYFLIAGMSRRDMLGEFVANYGPWRLPEFFAIAGACPDRNVLRYGAPERYPFLRTVLRRAQAIIVHSETSAARLRAMRPRAPVRVAPLLAYAPMLAPPDPAVRAAERAALGVGADEFLIGCFGFIGPSKRPGVLFEALAQLKDRLKFRLLLVGEGQDVSADIEAAGLADRVLRPGFVEEARFGRLLQAVDVLVNLRFPSMGETSATLIQAMACALPCLVTDDAWFSELPDETVVKVPIGTGEVGAVAEALLTLAGDPALRARLGAAARAYVLRVCDPAAVARLYLDCLSASR